MLSQTNVCAESVKVMRGCDGVVGWKRVGLRLGSQGGMCGILCRDWEERVVICGLIVLFLIENGCS